MHGRSVLFALALVLIVAVPSVSGQERIPSPAVAEVLERAESARGGRQALSAIHNSKAIGTLTIYGYRGDAAKFDVVLLKRGRNQVQRLITQSGGLLRQGSNGKESWNSVRGFISQATGPVQRFIESQTTRSVEALLEHAAGSVSLMALEGKAGPKVIEAQDGEGRKTRYSFDASTSLATKLEIIVSEGVTMFGKPAVESDTYVFSDYRTVSGIPTPFKIERYRNTVKIEEMQFTSVTFNTTMADSDFTPTP